MRGYQVWEDYEVDSYNGSYTESRANLDHLDVWLNRDDAQHFVDRLNCEEEMRHYLVWREAEDRKKAYREFHEAETIKAINAGISKAVLLRDTWGRTETEFKMPWGASKYYLEEIEVIE